jgi:hypothetical protein
MQRISRTLVASLVVATAALAGCGGGGGGDDGGGSGSGLVGVWRADIGGIVSENPLLIAATGRGTCTGPVVLTFKADGTFTQTLNGRCAFTGGRDTAITVNATGNYAIEGAQIRVTNAVNSGTIVAGGTTQSFSLVTNGQASYTLSGNELVLKPAVERGTQQTYTRG